MRCSTMSGTSIFYRTLEQIQDNQQQGITLFSERQLPPALRMLFLFLWGVMNGISATICACSSRYAWRIYCSKPSFPSIPRDHPAPSHSSRQTLTSLQCVMANCEENTNFQEFLYWETANMTDDAQYDQKMINMSLLISDLNSRLGQISNSRSCNGLRWQGEHRKLDFNTRTRICWCAVLGIDGQLLIC